MANISSDLLSRLKALNSGHKGTNSEKFILIIEDDAAIIEFLTEIVKAAGFGVLVAGNIQAGISIFEAKGDNIICIILDYGISSMHPQRMVSKFREINSTAKVILASGYSKKDIIKDISLENIDGYIPKPFDPNALLIELSRIVETIS
jgi:DNA-binding response OmpR family regulator